MLLFLFLWIISTRRLFPICNVETLVYSVPIVLSKFPDTKFIIGSSGVESGKLNQLSKKLQVDDNIIFTGRISD